MLRKKVFAYECSNGDKGIIIAKSIEKAKKIFNKKLFVTFELDFYIKFYTTLSFRRTRVVF